MKGETNQEVEKVRAILQADINYLNEENTTLSIETNELRRKV